jgi:2Fe-2S ferredoxin
MPRVTVEPSGLSFEAVAGATIMEAARAAGYWWPNTCNGRGECTTCAAVVLAGADALSVMGRAEQSGLLAQRGRAALEQSIRLSCQARVYGDVAVRKPGVRE